MLCITGMMELSLLRMGLLQGGFIVIDAVIFYCLFIPSGIGNHVTYQYQNVTNFITNKCA